MRALTFYKGSLQEGIKADALGTKLRAADNQGESSGSLTFISRENPPPIKDGRVRSTALLETGGCFVFTNHINGGPNKKRNNKTLLRIKTFSPYFENEQPAHFGGEWSVIKGHPKILHETKGFIGNETWYDSLIVMSPEDIVCISYNKPGMQPFFLYYEETHRGKCLVSHDSRYYLRELNDRPRNKREREVARKNKELRSLLPI